MSNFFAKQLIVIGIIIVGIGMIFLFKDNIPFIKHLGKLPGDITIKKENFSFYFPVATSILISIVLTIILLIIRKFK